MTLSVFGLVGKIKERSKKTKGGRLLFNWQAVCVCSRTRIDGITRKARGCSEEEMGRKAENFIGNAQSGHWGWAS